MSTSARAEGAKARHITAASIAEIVFAAAGRIARRKPEEGKAVRAVIGRASKILACNSGSSGAKNDGVRRSICCFLSLFRPCRPSSIYKQVLNADRGNVPESH